MTLDDNTNNGTNNNNYDDDTLSLARKMRNQNLAIEKAKSGEFGESIKENFDIISEHEVFRKYARNHDVQPDNLTFIAKEVQAEIRAEQKMREIKEENERLKKLAEGGQDTAQQTQQQQQQQQQQQAQQQNPAQQAQQQGSSAHQQPAGAAAGGEDPMKQFVDWDNPDESKLSGVDKEIVNAAKLVFGR